MKNESKLEAWVKDEVKKIFAEFGCDDPYMPPPAIYGRRGGADFIECMFGRYIAVETKRLKKKQTKLQIDFAKGVLKRGGIYLLIYENNLYLLRNTLQVFKEEANDFPFA